MIKVNDVVIEQNHFPDNTLLMKFNPISGEFNYCDSTINIEWKYENDAELFSLICVKRHIESLLVNPHFTLTMDYIPHARMDRVKSDDDVFTLKYFCEIINSLHFDVVWVRDAHSSVSLALLENVCDLGAEAYIYRTVLTTKPGILFYPDEGAMKRYSKINNIVQMPYAFGIKNRDWETGKIFGLTVMNAEAVKDKDVLIIDDICSRGGTFLHSAKTLKDLGAKNIYLYVSHLEKTVLEGELYQEMKENDLIKTIYTANPLFEITKDIERIIKL